METKEIIRIDKPEGKSILSHIQDLNVETKILRMEIKHIRNSLRMIILILGILIGNIIFNQWIWR